MLNQFEYQETKLLIFTLNENIYNIDIIKSLGIHYCPSNLGIDGRADSKRVLKKVFS